VLTLTMHPQAIGWGGRIGVLEYFIDHVKSKGDVRFTTCTEVADDFRRREAEQQSAITRVDQG
jgi:peptidoglycan/xylan/chitin deacetylase (PgdA/CDA1 family)